jgi:hypothetical protein
VAPRSSDANRASALPGLDPTYEAADLGPTYEVPPDFALVNPTYQSSGPL